MKIALVCIAKDEDPYIQEWINYHLKFGFDDIFIIQNDWNCPVQESEHVHLLKDTYPSNVNFTYHQIDCYSDFFKEQSSNYDWIAVFDVDEFLFIKNCNDIHKFLSTRWNCDSICVHWRMFGDNNVTELDYQNYSVIERFTRCCDNLSSEFKSIYNTKKLRFALGSDTLKNTSLLDVHELKHLTINGINLDTLKYSVDGITNVSSKYELINHDELKAAKEIAYLAHYRKSYPEYQIRYNAHNSVWWTAHKKEVGSCEASFKKMCPPWFNEIENLDLVNFMKG